MWDLAREPITAIKVLPQIIQILKVCFFEVTILIFLTAIFYGILSSHKEKADKGGFFIKLIHIIISLFLIVAFIGSAAYLLS